VIGVADLERTYAFYHAVGIDLERPGPMPKPAVLPEALTKLVDVPAGTKFRNLMLKIPNAEFAMEVTEFSGMELHPVKPRVQDGGASVLFLRVNNVDAALGAAKKAGAEVISTGGGPVTVQFRNGVDGRTVTVRDPDGYYVELAQPPDAAPGPGEIIGARFGFVVQDSARAANFYRDYFGLDVRVGTASTNDSRNVGLPAARIRAASATIPGTKLQWSFGEFQGVDRKSYTPRIPDPGAAAVGLQVRDIDTAIAAIQAAGGTSITQGGSIQLGKNKVGFVRDPSGILVEFAQP